MLCYHHMTCNILPQVMQWNSICTSKQDIINSGHEFKFLMYEEAYKICKTDPTNYSNCVNGVDGSLNRTRMFIKKI